MLSTQITEKRLLAVSPKSLATDGTANGTFTITESAFFRVGQDVILHSTNPAITDLHIRIKRIVQDQIIHVGLKDTGINKRYDISAFTVADGATVSAIEQLRPPVPEFEIERLTYEEEPVVARRVVLVDKYGSKYETDNPIPVQLSDGSINIGTVNAELEVQLSHQNNVPDAGDVADSVQIGDGSDILEVNADGSINVNIVGASGTPVIHREAGTFTDITETAVATFTTLQANTFLRQIMMDAPTFGAWRIYTGSVIPANLLAVKRTSSFEQNGEIVYDQPEKVLTSGTDIIITFEAERYRAPLLGATANTFVRVDGYY